LIRAADQPARPRACSDLSLLWAVLFRGDDERVVKVTDFQRFAACRGIAADESQLDSFVEALGGNRDKLIVPWSVPGRRLRRPLGKPIDRTDVYAVPRTR
jgi:hypothetical protein